MNSACAAAWADWFEATAAAASRLAEACRRTCDALVAGDVAALRAALATEEERIAALRACEERRQALAAGSDAAGTGDVPTTARSVVAALAAAGFDGEARRAAEAARRLGATLDEIARVNEARRRLAQQGLAAARTLLHAVTGEVLSYGRSTVGAPSLRLDRRA